MKVTHTEECPPTRRAYLSLGMRALVAVRNFAAGVEVLPGYASASSNVGHRGVAVFVLEGEGSLHAEFCR
jgi:hypothetical protein